MDANEVKVRREALGQIVAHLADVDGEDYVDEHDREVTQKAIRMLADAMRKHREEHGPDAKAYFSVHRGENDEITVTISEMDDEL